MYRYIVLFLLFLTAFSSRAQLFTSSLSSDYSYPKREVRAVWMTTIGGLDWPHSYAQSVKSIEKQKNELRLLLDKLKLANINTVLLQTRIRGTVIYPSKYEPWDGCMSGNPNVSPGYDPLEFAVEECHKRGMEIHAWVVSLPIGKASGAGYVNMRKAHPELITKIGNEYFMRPENDKTAGYLATLCSEIVENYDVDGIHLDYIRYSENQKLTITQKQARQNISNIVKQVSVAVKHLKPWIKMSCSPIGKRKDLNRYWSHGWNAEEKGLQDVELWLREGWMDQIYPMMYFRRQQFFPFVADWKEQCHKRTVISGLGIYFLSPKEANWPIEDIERELWVCRSLGIGNALFRNKFFVDDTKGIYSFIANHVYTYPSLVPEMTWYNHPAPSSPSNLKVEITKSGYLLSWDNSPIRDMGKTESVDLQNNNKISYNVYGSSTIPVDISDPRNIVAVRLEKPQLFVPKSSVFRYFAITAIDRYGKESKAIETDENETDGSDNNISLLRNTGNYLDLPPKHQCLDADCIVFETATGVSYTIKPYINRIAIDDVPDGMYVLRSLSSRGKTHRIGWAFIRRK